MPILSISPAVGILFEMQLKTTDIHWQKRQNKISHLVEAAAKFSLNIPQPTHNSTLSLWLMRYKAMYVYS